MPSELWRSASDNMAGGGIPTVRAETLLLDLRARLPHGRFALVTGSAAGCKGIDCHIPVDGKVRRFHVMNEAAALAVLNDSAVY